MQVTIVSAEKKEQFAVDALECITMQGNLTILEGHKPELILLKNESLIVLHVSKTDKVERHVVHDGIVEVMRDGITIVLT